jgi:hypothetical protein
MPIDWDLLMVDPVSFVFIIEIITLIRFVFYLTHQVSRKMIKLVVSSTEKAVNNHLADVNTLSLFLPVL